MRHSVVSNCAVTGSDPSNSDAVCSLSHMTSTGGDSIPFGDMLKDVEMREDEEDEDDGTAEV
jgi:hypothetical protein